MRIFTHVLLFLISYTAFSQPAQRPALRARRNTPIIQQGEQTDLRSAIAIALERNYQIRVAQTQVQVAQNNAIPGFAGFYPTLAATLNNNNTVQNIRQTYIDNIRPPQYQIGVPNRSTTVGLNFNWTIFNGFGMFYSYDQLKELVRVSEVNTRANIELTTANVAASYYSIIRELEQLLSFRQALDISRERLELARATYEVGTRSKVDFLSAQVDYNADSSALIIQQQNVRNAKIALNTLLVRDPGTEFAVRDTILLDSEVSLDRLQQAVLASNPQLVAAALNRRVADYNIRLAQAQRYPVINVQAGYNFTAINNTGGFGVRTGRNDGFNYGIQASIPIFSGFNQRRLLNNAKANARVAEYQEADQRTQILQALEQTFTQYQNNLALVNLEVENVRIANQNVEIAFDRYRVGNSTAVEFRDVQRNVVAAEARLIDAEYNAKLGEIELLRLSSTITQELK